MRLAIINQSGRIVGGLERYLDSSIARLAKAGHNIRLWHDDLTGVAYEAKQQIRAESCLLPWTPGRKRATALAALSAWNPDVICVHSQLPLELERDVLELGPCVFFSHGYVGTCISGAKTLHDPIAHPCERILGPGCLLHYFPHRCGGLNALTMFRDYARNVAQLRTLHDYSAVVTFSSHMRVEYLRHGLDSERLKTVPPFCNVDILRAPGRAVTEFGEEALTVGFMGRLESLKGVDLLIDSLPGVAEMLKRRIQLVIAGDGAKRQKLESRATSVMVHDGSVEVEFTGWLNEDRFDDFYSRISLLVVPSVWPEAFGLVGLEAAERGIPVAAFSVGGIPEWLTDGLNGHLAAANPPNVHTLSRAIVQCVEDPRHYADLCDGALQVAGRFSADRHVHALTDIFEHVVEGRRRPRGGRARNGREPGARSSRPG